MFLLNTPKSCQVVPILLCCCCSSDPFHFYLYLSFIFYSPFLCFTFHAYLSLLSSVRFFPSFPRGFFLSLFPSPSPSLLLSLVSPSFVLQRAYRDVICPLTHLERKTCTGGAHSSSSSSHYFDFSKTCLTNKSGKTIGN